MVGGEVIGVTRYEDGTTRVLCSEWVRMRSGKTKRDDRNACWVKVCSPDGDRQIQVGDWLWWQSNKAMWTPKEVRNDEINHHRCGVDYDIQLERIGYSVGANL